MSPCGLNMICLYNCIVCIGILILYHSFWCFSTIFWHLRTAAGAAYVMALLCLSFLLFFSVLWYNEKSRQREINGCSPPLSETFNLLKNMLLYFKCIHCTGWFCSFILPALNLKTQLSQKIWRKYLVLWLSKIIFWSVQGTLVLRYCYETWIALFSVHNVILQ